VGEYGDLVRLNGVLHDDASSHWHLRFHTSMYRNTENAHGKGVNCQEREQRER
jgi:hypothetical protein